MNRILITLTHVLRPAVDEFFRSGTRFCRKLTLSVCQKSGGPLKVTDVVRNAWKVGVGREVHQTLTQVMTLNGQLLVSHLLKVGKVECPVQFLPEISINTQNEQMDLAVKHGLVRREQEPGGSHRTFYLVNPDYDAALKKILPQLLS